MMLINNTTNTNNNNENTRNDREGTEMDSFSELRNGLCGNNSCYLASLLT